MLKLRFILCSGTGPRALGIAAVLALAGCGQKGPLYLPDGPAAANRATLPEILTRRGPTPTDPAPPVVPGAPQPPSGGMGTGTAAPVRTP